ncbi:MAG: YgjP-like metallopeptidase domain-containing protein [Bacilli bacterium]
MDYLIKNEKYTVEIIKKRNKNTYIRVKEDLTIQVTTNYFATKKEIKGLLDKNIGFLENTIEKRKKEKIKKEGFYIFGVKYEIVVMKEFKNIKVVGNVIYTPDPLKLEKWLKKETKRIFQERVKENYKKFEENIPFPEVKMRNMKTRWGVCNRKLTYITLNSNLIKETIDKLDYVIIHELSHFVHFNHSKEFWEVVAKYCPKYKTIRKELRE